MTSSPVKKSTPGKKGGWGGWASKLFSSVAEDVVSMSSVVAGTSSPQSHANPNPLNPTGLPRPVAPLLPQLEGKTDLGQFLLKFACKGEVRKFNNLQVRYSHSHSLHIHSHRHSHIHSHMHTYMHIHMRIQFSDISTLIILDYRPVCVPMWYTES